MSILTRILGGSKTASTQPETPTLEPPTPEETVPELTFLGFREASPVCAAADAIGLSNKEIAKIFKISCQDVERMRVRDDKLDDKAEAFLKFVTIFRTFMNDDPSLMRQWLRTENMNFGGTPIEVMTRRGGLTLLRRYLDLVVDRRDQAHIAHVRDEQQ